MDDRGPLVKRNEHRFCNPKCGKKIAIFVAITSLISLLVLLRLAEFVRTDTIDLTLLHHDYWMYPLIAVFVISLVVVGVMDYCVTKEERKRIEERQNYLFGPEAQAAVKKQCEVKNAEVSEENPAQEQDNVELSNPESQSLTAKDLDSAETEGNIQKSDDPKSSEIKSGPSGSETEFTKSSNSTIETTTFSQIKETSTEELVASQEASTAAVPTVQHELRSQNAEATEVQEQKCLKKDIKQSHDELEHQSDPQPGDKIAELLPENEAELEAGKVRRRKITGNEEKNEQLPESKEEGDEKAI